MTPSRTSVTPSGSPGRDWFTELGLLVAALAAIVSSGTALAGVASLAGWPTWLAVMLPATVDVYAITATRVWLSQRTTSDLVRGYAKWNALSAIAVSIVGNTVYHALVAGAVRVPRWILVVAVSMVPPMVIAALAHMTALRTREHDAARAMGRRKADRSDTERSGKTGPRRRTTAAPSPAADRTRPTTSSPVRAVDPDQFADAVGVYRASVEADKPLSERKLADRYGQSRRWARKVIDAARPGDGHEGTDSVAERPRLTLAPNEQGAAR